MRNDKPNIIADKTIGFSLSIIKYCEVLENQKKYIIARQLLRSATSIGANVFEAQNAESKADFIHKMSIALKEANETQYWLLLLRRAEYMSEEEFASLHLDIEELLRLLTSIIKTSKLK